MPATKQPIVRRLLTIFLSLAALVLLVLALSIGANRAVSVLQSRVDAMEGISQVTTEVIPASVEDTSPKEIAIMKLQEQGKTDEDTSPKEIAIKKLQEQGKTDKEIVKFIEKWEERVALEKLMKSGGRPSEVIPPKYRNFRESALETDRKCKVMEIEWFQIRIKKF